MIDTVVLAGLTHPTLRSRPPSGPTSLVKAEAEWQWIEQTLESSKADWIIVAGHYPGKSSMTVPLHNYYSNLCHTHTHTVWSVAEHGPTLLLVEKLRPMLQKYNVSS